MLKIWLRRYSINWSLLQRPFPPECQLRGGSCSLSRVPLRVETECVLIKLNFTGNSLLSNMALLWCGAFWFGFGSFFSESCRLLCHPQVLFYLPFSNWQCWSSWETNNWKANSLFYLFDSDHRNLESSHCAPRNIAFFRSNDGSKVVTVLISSPWKTTFTFNVLRKSHQVCSSVHLCCIWLPFIEDKYHTGHTSLWYFLMTKLPSGWLHHLRSPLTVPFPLWLVFNMHQICVFSKAYSRPFNFIPNMSFNVSNLSVIPLYSHPSASIHLKWHSTEQSFPIQPYSGLFIECAGNRLMRDRGQRCHSPFYDPFVWIQHLHWCPLKYFDLSALWPHLFVTYQAEHILSFLTVLYYLTSKIKKWKFFIIETFYIHLLPMSINFPVILSR